MLMSGLPLFPPQFNQIQLFFKIHAASAPFVTSGSSSNVEHKPSGPDGGMTYSRNWFSYEELIKATDGFSTLSLLGEGGFGFVYKGCLPDGREIAVKQLKIGGSQGEREFKAEVEIINRTPSSPLVPRIKRSAHTFPPITHKPHHLHFSLFFRNVQHPLTILTYCEQHFTSLSNRKLPPNRAAAIHGTPVTASCHFSNTSFTIFHLINFYFVLIELIGDVVLC